ncbi:MAG: hypothetical protein WCJ63_01725 [Actinomycetes bacterium]
MIDGIDAARFQWDDGERRLAAAPDTGQSLQRVTEQLVQELRRRLGGPFMASELVALYESGTDWCFQFAVDAAPSNPEAWDGATVTDAAFGRYLREASDYAGGRIVHPFDRED